MRRNDCLSPTARFGSFAILLAVIALLGGCGKYPWGDFNNPFDPNRTYRVGDTGPAGGLIFQVNSNYAADGWHYMEAAPSDQSSGIPWHLAANMNPFSTQDGIGSGKANTTAIVGNQGPGSYAAAICADLVLGGHDDWFLPSYYELYFMYLNLKTRHRGGFTDAPYWSSTASDYSNARFLDFGSGSETTQATTAAKLTSHRVRAVRQF
jgi:hypothetical protein